MMLLVNNPIESPIRFCNNVPVVIASKPKTQDAVAIKGAPVPGDGEITTTTPARPIKMPTHSMRHGFPTKRNIANAVVSYGWVDAIKAAIAEPKHLPLQKRAAKIDAMDQHADKGNLHKWNIWPVFCSDKFFPIFSTKPRIQWR